MERITLKKLKINTRSYSTIFFTSDWHLGHNKEFLYCPRGQTSRNGHVDWLINEINKLAKPNDLIIHMGDMCLTATMDEYVKWMNLINCKNIMSITGNHDNRFEKIVEKQLTKDPIENLGPYQEVTIIEPSKVAGKKAWRYSGTLCHFPMLLWNNAHHGAFHLCGHSHGTLAESGPYYTESKRLDCGVENALKWSRSERVMFDWSDIKVIMATKGFFAADHHNRSTT